NRDVLLYKGFDDVIAETRAADERRVRESGRNALYVVVGTTAKDRGAVVIFQSKSTRRLASLVVWPGLPMVVSTRFGTVTPAGTGTPVKVTGAAFTPLRPLKYSPLITPYCISSVRLSVIYEVYFRMPILKVSLVVTPGP